MSQQLLAAADNNIERLKLVCEDVLIKGINTDVAAATLVLAGQHGCCGLKEACFKYL
jgi:speckle-type POZ protein